MSDWLAGLVISSLWREGSSLPAGIPTGYFILLVPLGTHQAQCHPGPGLPGTHSQFFLPHS